MDRVEVMSERSAFDRTQRAPIFREACLVNLRCVDQRRDVSSAGWLRFKRGGER
jgi:hypothetical protein